MLALLTEGIGQAFLLLPTNMVGSETAGNLVVETYDTSLPDPWYLKMLGSSLSLALMCLLWAVLKMDRKARFAVGGWGAYFVAQATQKVWTGNYADREWHVDLLILAACVGAALLIERHGPRWYRSVLNIVP